ncbi:MAG: pentapeptide repeat-containing protein [Parvibaculum sp.]|uniref:pentapeptide repeat-containing protein n=1 Tax=Parvibaculum sp. TaxID=2024848 RepID=UPI003C7410D3
MSLAVPATAPEPLGLPDETGAGLNALHVDAFITTIIFSICLHVLLSLIGAYRFAEPPPAYQRARDLPHINAELVPPQPQAAEAIGEAQKAAEAKLPPVDAKLVNSMIADAGKTLLACRNCTLAGANFNKAYLRLASLQDADLRKAQLTRADLTGTRLARANLEGADLSHANAAGIDLTGANLKGADLSHARLDAALVENADFTGAKLVGANLRLIEYVKGVKFRDVDATGAIFRYASLRGVDFRGANLSGADFTRAWGLSNEQLALACGDDKTRLPDGLVIPTCRKADGE